MSHLPAEVAAHLQKFVSELEERLQSEVHAVVRARSLHRHFRRNHIVMGNMRGLVFGLAEEIAAEDPLLEFVDLTQSGWALKLVHGDRRMIFRWKKATLNSYGQLSVMVPTDSTLTRLVSGRQGQLNLFATLDPAYDEEAVPSPVVDDEGWEMWIIANIIERLSLVRVTIAWPAALATRRPPYRLVLADPHDLNLEPPAPPSFPGDDDDLWDDEDQEGFGS